MGNETTEPGARQPDDRWLAERKSLVWRTAAVASATTALFGALGLVGLDALRGRPVPPAPAVAAAATPAVPAPPTAVVPVVPPLTEPAAEPPPLPPPPAVVVRRPRALAKPLDGAGGIGAITVICIPKCAGTKIDGIDLGPGHVFNRPTPAGSRSVILTGADGTEKELVAAIAPGRTTEVRVTMAGSAAKGRPTLYGPRTDEIF